MKRLLFINIFAALLFSSCSGYLNQSSQDEVIVQTVSDFSELLLGAGYPSPSGNNGLYNIIYLLDDDMQFNDNVMEADEDYTGATGAFAVWTWQPDMWQDVNLSTTYYNEPYSSTYTQLMGVNAVLDGIDEASGDAEERDQVKAEALALRGYYYFMLVNLFAQPYSVDADAAGVPLKLTANTEINGRPRSTVREVYAQIISDLQTASTLFGKYKKRRGSYRINRPAVNILLTRVYLQMEDWDNVIASANEAIADAEGLTDYTTFSSYATISTYDLSEVEWLYGNGYRPCSLPGLVASSDLISLYSSTDRRKTRWFQGAYNNIFKHRLASSRTPTNAMRISEAYIARAEAYVRKGMLTESADDVNLLCSKRYTNYRSRTFASQEELLEEVLKQRRLELCYDEVRWFDLRRLGMPNITHQYKSRKSRAWQTYTLQQGDPLYTLPIPNDVIMQNTELTQNASANQPARTASSSQQ